MTIILRILGFPAPSGKKGNLPNIRRIIISQSNTCYHRTIESLPQNGCHRNHDTRDNDHQVTYSSNSIGQPLLDKAPVADSKDTTCTSLYTLYISLPHYAYAKSLPIQEEPERSSCLHYKMSLNRYGLVYDGDMRLNMDDKELRTLEQEVKASLSGKHISSPAREITLRYSEMIETVIEKTESQATSFEKASTIWKQSKDEVASQWGKIAPKLVIALQQYQALRGLTKPLVEKEISEWDISTITDIVSHIDKLLDLVGQIINNQGVLASLEVLSSSPLGKTKSNKPELETLIIGLSNLLKNATNLSGVTSLSECSVALGNLITSYNKWLTQVTSIQNTFTSKIRSWLLLCVKVGLSCTQDLEAKLKEFEAANIMDESFSKFIAHYNGIVKLIDVSREEFKKTLTRDQVTILETIANYLANEENMTLQDLENNLGKLTCQHMR